MKLQVHCRVAKSVFDLFTFFSSEGISSNNVDLET